MRALGNAGRASLRATFSTNATAWNRWMGTGVLPKKKMGRSGAPFLRARWVCGYLILLMETSSALPALKRTTFFALILIGAPVWGLRPVRAFRREMPNVPKPTSVTLFPLRRDRSMLPTSASIAFAADAFVIAASLATLSISSVLFIDFPLFGYRSLAGDPRNAD